MTDDAIIKRALRDADAGTGVSHGASGQALSLQKRQACNACICLAHTSVVEHTEQWPSDPSKPCRTDAAMRATHSDAIGIAFAELGDGVDQSQGGHGPLVSYLPPTCASVNTRVRLGRKEKATRRWLTESGVWHALVGVNPRGLDDRRPFGNLGSDELLVRTGVGTVVGDDHST
jgi:hypothetical protein